MTCRLFQAVVFSVAVGWASLSSGADDDVTRAGQAFFENKIRPVLVKRCFPCHAGEKREGKLRLDRRDFLIQGGQSGRVVQPGEPNASVLIRAIRRVDNDLKMPPNDADQLSAGEIQDFVTWIKLGVPFPGDTSGAPAGAPVLDLAKARQFWSLRPLLESTPPQPDREPHSRIDEFVRAKLMAAGMQPSPAADKQTLLRRATYDLTGLPPTPAEIDAFLADTSTDAFANVVERLLDSPQYGVHWARHWFDVVRYGDTRWVGAGEDRRWPFAYTYRDWVIGALNEDLPYDRFVTLQLAADQVPDARQADQAALGFLTVGRWFTGTLPDVIDDQIDVVTRGLLGVSAQCARCHDHKYDPISTQDYYSLYGLFAAAQMPVDGTGVLAELPEVRSRPVDAATEQEITALRGRVDEFLNTRLTDLRNRFRTPDKMRQYMTAAEGLLPKMDHDVRAFAKSQELDERILQRWVRYLRNTTKNPHPIFAPWHALATLPEADFESQATAAIENAITAVGQERGGKFNKHVAERLTPAPKSLAELTQRYVDLFTKYDVAETSTDPDAELLRQVMRSNDSPVQVSMNELGQFLSPEGHAELVQRRRTVLAKLVALPEKADHYLTFQHDAAPLLKEVRAFLDQRRVSVAADVRSPDKIAAYLLAAREAETTSDGKMKSLAKSRQISELQLRRWMDYLKHPSRQTDPVFATWLAFAAVNAEEFANQAAPLTEQAKKAGGNRAVALAFETPPASLSEVAKRCAELIVRCHQSEPFPDADHEAIRQLTQSADFPLRRVPDDLLDYFTQKDFDGLRDKERNLLRLYLESPGSSPRAMVLRESSHSYAQRVFVRGNPNQQGEPSHGGFITVLAADEPRPFTHGRGRAELAQSIVDRRNPLTARVIVNRVWQWHFGAGLVQTPSDFGTRGTAPTHPELLDFLAGQFMRDGWSLKKLHRQILLSSTWQQSSQDNPAHHEADPENRLLWRMNRRRLSFEEMRDSLLAVGGRLDTTIGGPPNDLVKNIIRRRTVFGTVDRVTLPGFYRYFDFPGADAHVPERHETIVAQQALYLMNNAFVMEQASHAARRTALVANTDAAARVEALHRLILGRSPTAEERSLGLEFIKSQPTEPPAASESAAAGTTAATADPWHYGWGSYDEVTQRVTGFEPFPAFVNGQWRGGPQDSDPVLGRASLNARGGYAGPSSELTVIRRWIAPGGGRLSVTGAVSSQLNSTQPQGDGVRARIVSSRLGQLGVWLAHGTEEQTDLQGVMVEPGDAIDFVVDARGRDMHGSFAWSPVLRLDAADNAAMATSVWDSAKDFKNPTATTTTATFDVWERYAQVLLETNEFLFLD